MVAYTKPQQRKKEESERPRGEIRSSLLILEVKDGKLEDSGKQEKCEWWWTREKGSSDPNYKYEGCIQKCQTDVVYQASQKLRDFTKKNRWLSK